MNEENMNQQDEIIRSESNETTLQDVGEGLGRLAIGYQYFVTKLGEGVMKAVNNTPPEILDTITPAKDERLRVTVHTSPWAGKTPEAVFDFLSKNNIAPEIIAKTLMEKVSDNKTAMGRLFYQDTIDQGSEPEATSCRRKIDDLLRECKKRYIVSFKD